MIASRKAQILTSQSVNKSVISVLLWIHHHRSLHTLGLVISALAEIVSNIINGSPVVLDSMGQCCVGM